MIGAFALGGLMRPNPNAPSETYDEFVHRMIDLKKAVIARALGASPEMQRAHEILYASRKPVQAKVAP